MGNSIQIAGSIILATIPALAWGYVFYKKNPEGKYITALIFIVGALSVFPILLYKISWQFFPWMNAFNFANRYTEDIIGFSSLVLLPLSVVITFMIVGAIEEVMKMLAVRSVDKNRIKTIDDSIEFFIIAALGFSFTENILYFYNIWVVHGADNLVLPFLFRSSFSTFAHLLFSGILGYYYGVAHFAKPILQEELRKGRKHNILTKLQEKFGFKKEKIFYREKLLEGLIIAIGLHALFNIFLEMGLTFMIIIFLFGGNAALNYLFNKKENHKNYGKLYESTRNHQVSGETIPIEQTSLNTET